MLSMRGSGSMLSFMMRRFLRQWAFGKVQQPRPKKVDRRKLFKQIDGWK
jgi:hypothetical protein